MGLDMVISGTGDLSGLRRSIGEFARRTKASAGDVVLAVDELVTNSLRYGGGRCRVHGTFPADLVLRIEVTDRGGVVFEFPTEFSPPSATSGRGLMIVRAVTSRCGIAFAATSTSVWFEVDVDDGA
jgi:anti-sigma regulatory factor (Ser/Thr protein kinase)